MATDSNAKETKIVKAAPKKTESQQDEQPRVTVKAAVIPQTRPAQKQAKGQTTTKERPAQRPPMGKPVVNRDLEGRTKPPMGKPVVPKEFAERGKEKDEMPAASHTEAAKVEAEKKEEVKVAPTPVQTPAGTKEAERPAAAVKEPVEKEVKAAPEATAAKEMPKAPIRSQQDNPKRAERNKEAEEFLKASVEAAVETGVVKNGDGEIFVETYEKNPRLIILGGGHVSLPVAEIGRMLGFHVTVMDDREEFVTEERFPMADERIFGDFDTLSDRIPPYENAYYVVVTRGHLGDSACARAILKRPFAYFGMIGSRTKVRITREKLLKEGFTEEQLDQIHAPIGLPIGGQMPAEIAVSIMAEIVQEKNRHFRTYCDEEVEAAVRRRTPGIMVTIIEKKGSSPRGTGSKMFVFRDGSMAGSIGGGKVEFEAGKHAVNIRNTETKVYELGQGAGDLGMICGGTVRVLFEPVNM